MNKFIVCLLLFIFITGCQQQPETTSTVIYEPTQNSETKTATLYQPYREQLDIEQKKLYDSMLQTYQSQKEKVTLDPVEQRDLEKIMQYILNDHPEIYYLSDQYGYEVDSANQEFFIYYPKYRFTSDEINEINQQIETITKPVLEEANKHSDDYEKTKYIFDYIIDQTSYVENSEDNQTILSVFLHNQSVCAGYAKSFQYLLSKLDISCSYITGYPRYETSQAHAWNMVKMNGDFYYMDITNADPIDGEIAPNYRYLYFALTRTEMLRLYEPDQEEVLELASSIQCNYFARNNAYFTTFDTTQLEALIDQQKATEPFSMIIQCRDAEVSKEIDNYIQSGNYLFDKTGNKQIRYYELGELNAHVYVSADER